MINKVRFVYCYYVSRQGAQSYPFRPGKSVRTLIPNLTDCEYNRREGNWMASLASQMLSLIVLKQFHSPFLQLKDLSPNFLKFCQRIGIERKGKLREVG